MELNYIEKLKEGESMVKIPFVKMNGCGNDFIIVDNRDDKLKNIDIGKFARRVCRRKISIGADGFMVIENSNHTDFKMRYFNADGSEAKMCGNGARCISRFAYIIGVAGKSMRFDTIAGKYESEITDGGRQVKLKFPLISKKEIHLRKHIKLEGINKTFHFAKVGVPHVVLLKRSVKQIPRNQILQIGKKVRFSKMFPNGTNVNFVEVVNEHQSVIRTYERGVEDETLACGTGSVASTIVLGLLGKVKSPVSMHTRGGVLNIHYTIRDNCIDEIFLEGDANIVAEGNVLPDAW